MQLQVTCQFKTWVAESTLKPRKQDSVVLSVSYLGSKAKKSCLDIALTQGMSQTEEKTEKHSTKRVQHTFHTMDLKHSVNSNGLPTKSALLVLPQYK